MDEAQFTTNTIKYQFMLARVIHKYIKDRETVKDLLQTSILKAWKCRDSFKGESSISTWLCSIAINTTINHLTAQKIRPLNRAYTGVETWDAIFAKASRDLPSPEESLQSQETRDFIIAAINDLPGNLKTVIVLRAIYGMSYDEISHACHLSLGTVKSRIHKGRVVLARKLGVRGFER